MTFDPSPAFSAILLSNELSLFWPTADFLSQGLEDSCFEVKWSLAFVHICWSFLRQRIVCRQQQDPFHSHDFGKAGNVSNIHSQLLRMTAKAGKKTDANFLTCEKKSYRDSDWSYNIFSSLKNRMTNEITSHQRNAIFIRRVFTEKIAELILI